KRRAPLAIAFSPDGRFLAAGSEDNIVWLYDTMQLLWPARLVEHVHRVPCLAFAPDGQWLASGAGDGIIILWDPKGKPPKRRGELASKTGWVRVVAFSPDGQSLVMGGGGDGALYLCDVRGSDVKIRQTLSKHTQFVHDVAFAPDGKTFLSAGEDQSVKVWNTA